MIEKQEISFQKTIQQYSDSLDREFRFVQLGCNDGSMADPISGLVKKNSWKYGIFVDADMTYLNAAYQLYKENCLGTNFSFSNVGVVTNEYKKGNDLNRRKFYSINPEVLLPVAMEHKGNVYWVYGTVPIKITNNPLLNLSDTLDPYNTSGSPLDYLQGVGSFDYDFVLDHFKNATDKQESIHEPGFSDLAGAFARAVFTEDIEEHKRHIRMHIITTATVNDIFERTPSCEANEDIIDLLQTDLETWDVKILEDLPTFKYKPKFIHFEAPSGVNDKLQGIFNDCGYTIYRTHDTRDYLAKLI